MALGIIAAAGKAERFNGILKELLPIRDGRSILENNIRVCLRGGADQVLIVSSPEKIAAHSMVAKRYPEVSLTLQKRPWDIYGAMHASFPFTQGLNFFVMADTVVPDDTFKLSFEEHSFYLGMFYTDTPDRFGCLVGDGITNKNTQIPAGARAWGTLVWNHGMMRHWLRYRKLTYTEAINMAIHEDGLHTYDLDSYYDISCWEDYWRYVRDG